MTGERSATSLDPTLRRLRGLALLGNISSPYAQSAS